MTNSEIAHSQQDGAGKLKNLNHYKYKQLIALLSQGQEHPSRKNEPFLALGNAQTENIELFHVRQRGRKYLSVEVGSFVTTLSILTS